MKLLIKNGEVVDGTGGKSYISDLLISNGIIEKIAVNINNTNESINVIDATGLVVTPGFIDMHSHSDATFTCETSNQEKLQQGVTTQINGNCGFGLFPILEDEEFKNEVIKDLSSVEFYINSDEIKWGNFEEFSAYFSKTKIGFGTNHIPLVPHGLIRAYVLGFGNKNAEMSHIIQMQKLLKEQLDLGAWGMSTGLAYAPGCFSTKEELIGLCRVLKESDKVYFSHIRDEGDMIIESVKEVIELAEESGVKVHISHLKAIGLKNHCKTQEIIELINEARSRGLKITADLYPYVASSTMLSILLPKEARVGNIKELICKLSDINYISKIKETVEYNINNRGGSEKIIINIVGNKKFDNLVGKTLKEISNIFGLSVYESVLKLIIENENIVNGIFFAISEEGIEKLLKESFISIGSDGMLNLENPNSSHPRTYGTFPRVFARYVRDKEILSLENAVYRVTKLPVSILNMENRGELKEGMIADITIFDKNKIKDNSTFEKSFVYPTGINYVLVKGEVVVENGKFQGKLLGELLKNN